MPTTRPEPSATSRALAPRGEPPSKVWLRPLVILTAVVALGDIVFMALIPSAVSPLVVGVVLTLVGIVLLRGRPRAGIAVLGGSSLVLGVLAVLSLSSHLGHPGSPVDFLHAVLAIVGRWLAVIAALGAWRGATEPGGRRLAAGALGLAGAAVAVSAVALLTVSGEAPRVGDVPVVIAGSQFPATVTVTTGETLHLDNQDVFRHTFTVADTDLDVDLPATTAARAAVELAPGRYDVICDIPGHEHMTAVLVVD